MSGPSWHWWWLLLLVYLISNGPVAIVSYPTIYDTVDVYPNVDEGLHLRANANQYGNVVKDEAENEKSSTVFQSSKVLERNMDLAEKQPVVKNNYSRLYSIGGYSIFGLTLCTVLALLIRNSRSSSSSYRLSGNNGSEQTRLDSNPSDSAGGDNSSSGSSSSEGPKKSILRKSSDKKSSKKQKSSHKDKRNRQKKSSGKNKKKKKSSYSSERRSRRKSTKQTRLKQKKKQRKDSKKRRSSSDSVSAGSLTDNNNSLSIQSLFSCDDRKNMSQRSLQRRMKRAKYFKDYWKYSDEPRNCQKSSDRQIGQESKGSQCFLESNNENKQNEEDSGPEEQSSQNEVHALTEENSDSLPQQSQQATVDIKKNVELLKDQEFQDRQGRSQPVINQNNNTRFSDRSLSRTSLESSPPKDTHDTSSSSKILLLNPSLTKTSNGQLVSTLFESKVSVPSVLNFVDPDRTKPCLINEMSSSVLFESETCRSLNSRSTIYSEDLLRSSPSRTTNQQQQKRHKEKNSEESSLSRQTNLLDDILTNKTNTAANTNNNNKKKSDKKTKQKPNRPIFAQNESNTESLVIYDVFKEMCQEQGNQTESNNQCTDNEEKENESKEKSILRNSKKSSIDAWSLMEEDDQDLADDPEINDDDEEENDVKKPESESKVRDLSNKNEKSKSNSSSSGGGRNSRKQVSFSRKICSFRYIK